MVDIEITNIVRKYLDEIEAQGIKISKAFIYGSQAKGTASENSDIDLMLISPLFDQDPDKYIPVLWLSTRKISYRIEPLAVGEKKYLSNNTSPLIEIVKHEGIEVAV